MNQSSVDNRANPANAKASRRGRPTLTPLAGAVRSVLAISGTLLALSGSGAAFAAGSCVLTTATTMDCDGAFTTGLPGTSFAPVFDMTLVLGASAPTSVMPGAGQVGVDAAWGGNVGVTSFADISTTGADGVRVTGTTSATVDNQGSITTAVTADGAIALDVQAEGNVTISNAGDVLAEGTGIHDVTAISAYSTDGDVRFDNLATGTVAAYAQDGNAIAVLGFAEGSGLFDNAGSITAIAIHGAAIGVLDQAYDGDATVTNSGSILADSSYLQAIGVLASSNSGHAGIDNSGSVSTFGGEDLSFALMASGSLGASIGNTGTITLDTSAGAITGAWASTQDGVASVSNGASGSITGYSAGAGDITALRADSTDGTAMVDNEGRISLITRAGGNQSIGMSVSSGDGSTLHNNGYVLAGSYSGGTVGGIAVAQGGDASIVNDVYGYVRSRSVSPDAYGNSLGLAAQALDGDASVVNLGTVFGGSNQGSGTGVSIRATGGDATGINAGTITGFAGSYANAIGLTAVSATGLATVANSGTINAWNQMLLGRFTDKNNIRGVEAFGYTGASVENTGVVDVYGAWYVRGVVAVSTLGDVQVDNAQGALISAKGMNAYGIQAEVQYGATAIASVDNAGNINVIQTGNCYCNSLQPVGVGIKIDSIYGTGIDVSNSGSIRVITQHNSYGIWGTNWSGDAMADNSGSIELFSSGFNSANTGISVFSHYDDTRITNSGDIAIEIGQQNTAAFNVDTARGMWGRAGAPHTLEYNGGPRPDGGGDVFMENTGTITILGSQAAYGMIGEGSYQRAELINAGDITAVSARLHSTATGMFALADNFRYAHDYAYHSPNGMAIVDNTGQIRVEAQETARGIRAFANNLAGAQVTNSGDVMAMASGGGAYGVVVVSFNYPDPSAQDLDVDNSGSITALNHAGTNEDDFRGGVKAHGILVNSFTNSIVVDNSGEIVVEATAGTCDSSAFAYACWSGATVGSAVGILASSGHGAYHGYYSGDIDVVNTGNISASVHSSSSTQMQRYAAYYGSGAFAAGILTVGDYGNVTSTNAGTITVAAKGEGYTPEGQTLEGWSTTAAGMMGSTYGSLDSDVGTIVLTNTGSISVSAEAVYADGTALAVGMGARHDTYVGDEYNPGRSNGQGVITVANYGFVDVASTVSGAGTGVATANGISTVSPATFGSVHVANGGRVQAQATGPVTVRANGVLASGSVVDVVLGESSIVLAKATGASGSAIGLSVSGDTVSASNAGLLQAEFVGGGNAFGARLASTAGSLAFDNSGSISAFGDNAIGVQLNNTVATLLTNSGTISAISEGSGSSAVRTGASADVVLNSGTINGAIDTGAGNDRFSNSATGNWNARFTSSFGTGDDSILNAGTIHLDNAVIDLGTSTTLGNSFNNTGWILVSGASSIDMGAANQNAFLNNGTIDFRNGVVGDTLHLAGNLGGSAVATGSPRAGRSTIDFIPSSGSVNFDVSGANGTADLLYVDGNVQAGTYNTVNINMLDLPTTAFSNIALIYVSGDSTAGSFRLGQVNYDPNGSFMTLAFNLVAQIDASNATPDVFSLGMGAGHGGGPIGGAQIGGTEPGRDGVPRGGAGGIGAGDASDGRELFAGGARVGVPTASIPTTFVPGVAGAPTIPMQEFIVPRGTSAAGPAVFSYAAAGPQPAGLEVSGLSDSGTMAASLAPGVQSLLGSEIGTWRQRLGIVDQFRKGSVALWARLFQDSGKVSPDNTAGNFGQGGNFAFDQRNSGIEVGADVAIAETFSVGLLAGQSDARQSLQETGAGVSRIDGDTFGGYATWISGGFYVDASYRHMSFDARLYTSSGELRTSGDADAFSIEGGYAWTVGDGFKIEPQIQYTRISVDDLDSMQGTLATFHSTGGVSSSGRLGVMGRKSFAAGKAVWTPYVSLNVVREFDGENGFDVNTTFFGETSTKGTSALIETGLNLQVGKFSVFGGLNWQDGGALDSIVSGQVGARYGW